MPGDTPLMDPGEVARLLRLGREERLGAIVVPDRHGEGTNALLLAPAGRDRARASAPAAASATSGWRASAGVACSVEPVPTLALDVDTGADLELLAAALAGRRGQAPSTRGALRQLDRSRASRRPPVPA